MTTSQTSTRVVGLTDRALDKIYDHVFENDDHEVAGVLVGHPIGDSVQVRSSIPAHDAEAERDSVTFTHDAWEGIYRELDSKYPGEQIVGWYHSHPGFGIFFSHHDAIAHQTSFCEPWQIALVIDPREGTQGVFGWRDGQIDWLEPTCHTSREGTGETSAVTLEPLAGEEAHEPEREVERADAPPVAAPTTAIALERGATRRYDLVALVVPFAIGLLLTIAAVALIRGGGETKPASSGPPTAPLVPDHMASRDAADSDKPKRDESKREHEPSQRQQPTVPVPDGGMTKEACDRIFAETGSLPAACEQPVFGGDQP